MNVVNFFATGQGVLLLGMLAASVVILWDWRVALGALFVIQVGVAALAVQIEGVLLQTMLVQTLVIGLCCLMLATSGIQVHLARSGRQSGGWFFRLLVLGLLAIALEALDLTFVLPELAPAITRIFGWIWLVALLMLSLGDNPLFTSVALLIWCVLGQAIAAVYVPVPEITVVIGLVELGLGLVCSYLILAEGLPRLRRIRPGAYGPPPDDSIYIPLPAVAPTQVAGPPSERSLQTQSLPAILTRKSPAAADAPPTVMPTVMPNVMPAAAQGARMPEAGSGDRPGPRSNPAKGGEASA